MLDIEKLESFDDPRLTPYRTMRRQFDHWEQEIFVAEGEKVVRRLIESSIPVISVLSPEGPLAKLESLLRKRPEQIVAFTASKPILEQLTGFSMYQGVLALAKVPAPASLDSVLSAAARPRLFAALDNLSNAENLGVVVRNCVGFGVQALILNETCAPPYLRRAVRSSMGTVFNLPHVRSAALPRTLRQLQNAGIRVIAAHPHTEEKSLWQADFSGDSCIVFGSEGSGISGEVLAACSEAVAIPMKSGTDSLNVASASAVFLYEAQRQRKQS
jgi:tRNA G18 (ribose-2'-O)-methylase SpoU